jgi:hypothetical protein
LHFSGVLNSYAEDDPSKYTQSVAGYPRIQFALARRTPDCRPTDGIEYLTTNALSYEIYFQGSGTDIRFGGHPVQLTDAGAAAINAQGVPTPTDGGTPLMISDPYGRPVYGDAGVPLSQEGTPAENMTWDPLRYLNVWVGNSFAYDPAYVSPRSSILYEGLYGCSGVAGITHGVLQESGKFGATDGITVNYQYLGTQTGPDGGILPGNYNGGQCGDFGGQTATHEIGHWLGLWHTFAPDPGGYCYGYDATANGATNPDPHADCLTQGDCVCDTPPITGGAKYCPHNTPPDLTVPNTCHNDQPVDNNDIASLYSFMSYNSCLAQGAWARTDTKYLYTAGQVIRMQALLHEIRTALLASPALYPPPGPGDPDPMLWIADTLDDVGDQPNTSQDAMYASEDIWIRNQEDGFTYQEHENPKYAAGKPVYVYVRVRNRGCKNYDAAERNDRVHLYWAKGSTALGWPAPWTDGPPVDGGTSVGLRMGGEIGNLQVGDIYVEAPPSNGPEPDDHSIVPGARILKFEWYPPNPEDYASIDEAKSHFCLLARIVDSSAPNDGMDYPEITPDTPAGLQLYQNVQNNRRIAWKNVEVTEDLTPDPEPVFFGTIGQAPDGSNAALEFSSRATGFDPVSLFSNWGDVEVDLGQELFDRWRAAGHKGSCDKTGTPNSVRITGCHQTIQNLPIRAGERFTIQLHLVRTKTIGSVARSYPDAYNLDMTETTFSGQRMGGQRFVFKTVVGAGR